MTAAAGLCWKKTCQRPSRTIIPFGSLIQPLAGWMWNPARDGSAHPAARPRTWRISCRSMIASRPGPTPIAETRAPISSSTRST